MNINKAVLEVISELYKKLRFADSDIRFIVNLFQNFIAEIYNPLLLNQLEKLFFHNLDSKKIEQIKLIFSENKYPFKKYDDVDKRLRFFKKIGAFVEPEINEIDLIENEKRTVNKLTSSQTCSRTVHIP